MNVPPLTDAEFARIYDFVLCNFGINLEKKRALVEARLSFYITKRGFRSFGEYLNVVMRDPNGWECRHMLNRLSTNYTYFFRERPALDYAAQVLVPDMGSQGKKRLEIWCAGCASGEEAYSLAMMLQSTTQVKLGLLDYSIYATDIDTDLLDVARAGNYPKEQLEKIPIEYREFVQRQGERIQMTDEVMHHIDWGYENLMNITYSSRWDIIFCRNVMIYFKPQTREDLTVALHRALRPGGCMIVGATESVDMRRRLFEHREPTVYRKTVKKLMDA